MINHNPPDRNERSQLRLSNAFANLAAVSGSTEVTVATSFTPAGLTFLAWIQDQPAPESQPNLTSNYQGPHVQVVKAMPPTDYPKGNDSKEALLQYLNDFSKKW